MAAQLQVLKQTWNIIMCICMYYLLSPPSLPPSPPPPPPPSLLVRLTYYTLRGDYFHSSPEEAFESAVHSVNGTANLQIVWLEYLSYLRDKALRNRGSNSVFKVLFCTEISYIIIYIVCLIKKNLLVHCLLYSASFCFFSLSGIFRLCGQVFGSHGNQTSHTHHRIWSADSLS